MRTLRGRAVALFLTVATVIAAGSISVPAATWRRGTRAVEPIARRSREVAWTRVRASGTRRLPARCRVQQEHRGHPDTMSADDKAELERAKSQLRSIGLLRDDVDLIDAISSLQTSGTLAKYDPETKRATVRGKKINGATEGDAGARAHPCPAGPALRPHQDPEGGDARHSGDALRALVEGDARRVQLLYAAELSSAERRQYETFQSSGADRSAAEDRAAGCADSLSVLFQSPYTLGPSMLDVVQAADGKQAIDGLFRDPPKADSAFLTPWTLVDDSKITKVAKPKFADGETAEGKPDVFGSFARPDAGGEIESASPACSGSLTVGAATRW